MFYGAMNDRHDPSDFKEKIRGIIFVKVFQSLCSGILKYRGLIIPVPGVLVCRNST